MATGKTSQVSSLVKNKGQLLLEQLKMQAAVPSKHDINADMFAKAGEDFDNRTSTGAILKGLMNGLSAGQKAQGASEKEQRMMQMQQKFQELQELQDKTLQAAQKAESEMQAKEALAPAMVGYIQASPKMDAAARMGTVKNMVSTFNEMTGNKWEIMSIDAQNPTLATIQDHNTGQTNLMNLAAMYADNPEVNKVFGSTMPTYQMEQQREDQKLAIQQAQLGVSQAHLGVAQSHEEREQQKHELEQKYLTPGEGTDNKPLIVLTPGERREVAKQHANYVKNAEESDAALRYLNDLDGIERAAEAAGIDLSGPLDRIDRYGAAYSKEKRNILKQYEKINSLLSQTQERMLAGKATDAARANIQKGLPTPDLPQEARRKAIETKRREYNINVLREQYYTQQLNKGIVPTNQGFKEYQRTLGGEGQAPAQPQAQGRPLSPQEREQKLQELQQLDALLQQRGGVQ